MKSSLRSQQIVYKKFVQEWKGLELPQVVDLEQFTGVLQHYLFLKSQDQLAKLDAKFVPGKSRELTPSQMQRCLIETAFALLQPVDNLVLQHNIMVYVMVLINIE